MKRDIYQELYSWKQRPDRKPLILNGARQVGKTTAIKTFAAEVFDDVLFLDFEEDKSLADHFVSLKPERIIESLSVQFARTITPGKTLLVFDEIQACPEALNSLKYFCEQMPELAVISAGSLLGVAIDNTGFPVGKVNMLNLYPLSFFEYLDAIDKTTWREHLENLKNLKAIPNSLHEELLRELRFYMMVGGMPEAVGSFIKNRDLNQVREIQKNILAAYELDFAKHAPKSMLMRIKNVWDVIPGQLAKENKKFTFSAIKASARAREYEEAIQWLKAAGLIHLVNHVAKPAAPLKSYAEKNHFKVYFLDVGLLCAFANVPTNYASANEPLLTEFKGALTENYVLQALVQRCQQPLFYWSSQGTAEIDFLIEHELAIYPLEVKAGASNKKKSLLVFQKKFNPPVITRTNALNFARQDKLLNYPLYAVSLFPERPL